MTEVPSGSRTVTGVATAITAFVGRASRGQLDEPVPINNFSEFERKFGGLWRGSGLGYAVRDFYLNGGGPALVVRVVKGADTATLAVGDVNVTDLGPGEWGNDLTIVVTYPSDVDAAEIATAQGVAAGDLFNLEVSDGTGPRRPRAPAPAPAARARSDGRTTVGRGLVRPSPRVRLGRAACRLVA